MLWRNFVKFAILAGFAKITAPLVPLSQAQSIFSKISSQSPFSPNSPDSSKSPLRQYPYLELNHSSVKFCQIHHSRRIRQMRRSVGTPISSSIALRQNFVTITILTVFAGFVRFIRIVTSSVPLCQAQSLFGEISSKSPDSWKSPLRQYPYLKLNRSLAKFCQNCHSRQIRQIHQNRQSVSTRISSSIALHRNFVTIAILAGFIKIAASSLPLSRAQSPF